MRHRTSTGAGVLLAIALGLVSGTASAAPLPRVTVIGDSVPGALAFDERAQAILRKGIDLRLEVAPCRRVDQTSCPYNGVSPPNVIEFVTTAGNSLGPTVIVAVGYNDPESEYAQNIENALEALRKAGVERVLWATLRAERQSYLNMNEMIRAAATRHPDLTPVDWNLYSRSHPDWFQPDGLHLDIEGARALATLLHNALVDLEIALPPSPKQKRLTVAASTLARGKAGEPYAARLLARGGLAPYRWARASGVVPNGLRLSTAGLLTGTPAKRGRFSFVVRVTDASRRSTTHRVVVQVA